MTELSGHNPRTGALLPKTVEETSLHDLDEDLRKASDVRSRCAASASSSRITWLQAVGEDLESFRNELVALADDETALGEARLNGELDRTIAQIKLFVDVLRDGSFAGVVIDSADEAARPELRRGLRAVGPVGVWAASNFPFAFGVIGGDTVSALAAGCPVIVKAHPSQPVLSARIGEIVTDALRMAGAPKGVFAVVHGMPAGDALITDPRLDAAAFTGSVRGGRALFDLAFGRPRPIPFYGELGSINPVVVTPAAARTHPDEIADGLLASATLGVGQFCTKPGLVFVPTACGIAERASSRVGDAQAGVMLNAGMRSGFLTGASRLADLDGVDVSLPGEDVDEAGFWVQPRVAVASWDAFQQKRDILTQECFGPLTVVVEYDDVEQLLDALSMLEGSLTGTIHGIADDPDDAAVAADVVAVLQDKVGRLVWNGWPTGVAVAWAMQHGGPYPASTNSSTTSVGAASIARFLRPVTFQSFPEGLLPEHLQDAHLRGVIRRDGRPQIVPGEGGDGA